VIATGVVTAEPGRLGTPPLVAIADASGGIVVRLPDGAPRPDRGDVLIVHGALADPYGQLEIRPTASGVTLLGTGALPDPVPVGSSGLGEWTEGRLVAVTGVLAGRVSKSTSHDLSMILETDAGTAVRIAADATSGIDADAFMVGGRYRIVGVAGQRASRKGALDGYKAWARDPRDVSFLGGPVASATAGATASPRRTATPRPTGASGGITPIAQALRGGDRDVTVQGVVTAPSTLLDSTGRRIVIQDATQAIEVLLPKDGPAPRLGRLVRVTGRVGSAYGSPRLRATAADDRGAGRSPAPLALAAPPSDTRAWMLVSVQGRIDSVRKLGERWQAELVVGGGRAVVIGQPGAGIASDALVEGRTAVVIGVVRRAYPTASDRRPAILPRTRADIRLSGDGHGGAASGRHQDRAGDGPTVAASGSAGAATVGGVPDADLVDLGALDGRRVRVGGLVTALTDSGFELDDGTAIGRVALTGPAAQLSGLLEPGDAVNVIGVVGSVEGGLGVIVDDPAAIVLGSDPAAAGVGGGRPIGPRAGTVTDAADDHPRRAGLGVDPALLPGAGAGLATLLGVGAASLGVTFLRRRNARRSLTSRIAARLAAVGGSSEAGPEASSQA
jgi:hypothetical protein